MEKIEKIELKFSNQTVENQRSEFQLQLLKWTTISELKTQVSEKIGIESNQFFLIFKGKQLNNNYDQLKNYKMKNNDIIQIHNKVQAQPLVDYNINYDNNINDKLQQQLQNQEYNKSLKQKQILKNNKQGASGSYILKNQEGLSIGIFKPIDEEINGPNSPGKQVENSEQMSKIGAQQDENSEQKSKIGVKQGIISGEGAYREVAAYIIDQQSNGQFKVPITQMVHIQHSAFNGQKQGSLQLFVENQQDFTNYPITLANVDEIHRIGILDIRILNCDRNSGNILFGEKVVDQNGYPQQFNKLIPIDHGLSFPSKLNIMDENSEWMQVQFNQPFNQENLDLIDSIDIDDDIRQLQKYLNISEQSLKLAKISTTLLKRYARTKTLYQLGQIIYRKDEDEPSLLEKIIEVADQLYEEYQQKQQKLQKLKQQQQEEKEKEEEKEEEKKEEENQQQVQKNKSIKFGCVQSQNVKSKSLQFQTVQSADVVNKQKVQQKQESVLFSQVYFDFIIQQMDLRLGVPNQQNNLQNN